MPNFYDRIAAAASRYGERPAIQTVGADGLATTTYRGLEALAGGAATWLTHEAGLRAGDRVAILSANSARWVGAYLGILRAGGVAVPLDTNYTAAQVATVLHDSGAQVLFVSERLEGVARGAVETRGGSTRIERLDRLPDTGATSVALRAELDAAAILYTSGTTADPKGVVLSHGNLEAERAAALSVIHVTETDAVLGVLPLFHALAQMANLLLPLATGARVVFLETVNSTTLLDALQKQGITVFACVPQFFYLVHERVMSQIAARGRVLGGVVRGLVNACFTLRQRFGINLGRRVFGQVHHALGPDMRFLVTGGSRFDPAIARDFFGMGLDLLNGYGLTETSGAATVIRPGDRFSTSVGPPLPGVDVRIVPDEIVGHEDRAAGVGEILIRGPIVMREYFGRPDATSETVDDGWLKTGDLGRIDAEGRVHITGRKKEIIVLSSGKNLYPEEIEAHYRQSPFIKELAILAVSGPGAPAAERLHAVVVPDADVLRARGIVNVKELIRFEIEGLAVKLPAHKRVLGYDISTEPLPRTTTGKLKRGEIERERRSDRADTPVSRPETADERAWLAGDGRQALVAAIAARLGRDRVGPNDNLELDLHLDSMERVELFAMLEERASRRVAPEARATIFTVRTLVEAVLAAPEADGPSPGSDGSGSEWRGLLAAPPDADISRDLSRPATLRALAFFVALRLCRFVLQLVLRLEIRGVEHVRRSGPYLICPNHQAYLDGFVVAMALPFGTLQRIFFVGASEYFESRLMKTLARAANIVPVDPDANLVTAMQAAATGLRLEKVLILFPEGERSIDGALKPFRKGAAILSTELSVPIVPAAIEGLYELWPRGRSFAWRLLRPWRRQRVSVTFGAPLHGTEHDYNVVTTRLEEAVRLLHTTGSDAR